MMANYVRETDEEMRQRSNRTHHRIVASLSPKVRRRYGYVFGDAVTGRDGEIIFGENDDFGHVWLYFPKILPV